MSDSFATSWTVAHQASLSMGFPRQEYWSGFPFPSPGDFPIPGMEPASPALAGRFFTTEPPRKPPSLRIFPLGFKPRCGEQGALKLVVALVPWLPTPRARWATRRGGQQLIGRGVSLRPAFRAYPSSLLLPSSQVTCVRAGGRTRPLSPRVCDRSGVYFFSSTWSDESCALTSSRQHPEPQVHDTWFRFPPRQAAWRWR